MIYLDNAATTPLDPDVLEEMRPFLTEFHGNPSSVHSAGRIARAAVERARESVAALFEADAGEIVFVSGGTEADNSALHIALRAHGDVHRTGVITSSAEHQAVLASCRRIAEEGGRITVLPVDAHALVDEDTLRAALDATTALVSLMHVNNETGAVHDIERLASIAHESGALFHTDAVQSAGKLPVRVHAWEIDLASASAHKIHGPKGIGALYVRRGLPVTPFITGGAQERGRRGGTENVPAIVGFGAAACRALAAMQSREAMWRRQRAILIDTIRTSLSDIIINAADDHVQPGIVSMSFPSSSHALDGETLLLGLDLEGVAASSGSACTAGSIEPSHVMLAIGHDQATSAATLRFSFGAFTRDDDVHRAAAILVEIVNRATQFRGGVRAR